MKGVSYKVVVTALKNDTPEGREKFTKELMKVFHISEELSKKIIHTTPVVVRKNCKKEEAEKLFHTLIDIGAFCNVEELISESYQGIYVPSDYGKKRKSRSGAQATLPLEQKADLPESAPPEASKDLAALSPDRGEDGTERTGKMTGSDIPLPPDHDPEEKEVFIPPLPEAKQESSPPSRKKKPSSPPPSSIIVTCLECGKEQPLSNRECEYCHYPLPEC